MTLIVSMTPLNEVENEFDMKVEFDFCEGWSSHSTHSIIIVFMDLALGKIFMLEKVLDHESWRRYLLLQEFDFEVLDKGWFEYGVARDLKKRSLGGNQGSFLSPFIFFLHWFLLWYACPFPFQPFLPLYIYIERNTKSKHGGRIFCMIGLETKKELKKHKKKPPMMIL